MFPILGDAFRITLALAVPLCIGNFLRPHLVLNHTESFPRGLYWRSSLSAAGPQRGQLVIACSPHDFALYGRRKGMYDRGECHGVESILKKVMGTPGDEVRLDAHGVWINGQYLANSQPLPFDSHHAAIPHVAFGSYHLLPGRYWLASPMPRSADSRYFGPVGDIRALAYPLLTFPAGR